jgi:hypothetical protein
MNRREIAAVVILALAALSPAIAQNSLPNASPDPAVAPSDQETKASTRSDRDSLPDARICLKFPTNLQIINCAEKYRTHKRKK